MRGLMRRKLRQLDEGLEAAAARFGCEYVLHIELQWVRPKVYRRVRVPGHIDLHTLQDKVGSNRC